MRPSSPTKSLPSGNHDPEVTIELGRYIDTLSRNWFRCSIVGLVVFLLVLLICVTRVPQSFTSQTSLSFPQTAQPTALNLLTGTGSTGSRYVGVLKSRQFAEAATKRGDVQRLCGFDTFEEAVEAVQTGVNVIDNVKDSLLYLSVTLNGPPRFSPGAEEQRRRVKQAAAKTANAYTQILRVYILTSDTDRDSVLLRAANEQLELAKRKYDAAAGQLSKFVLRNSGASVVPNAGDAEIGATDAGSQSGDGGQTGAPTGLAAQEAGRAPRPSTPTMAARELETLYIERGRLAADIEAALEAIRSSGNLRQSQISKLGSLPAEDPLLASARMEVSAARSALSSLSLQFGPDHPEVRKAEERLSTAEAGLRKQTRAIVQRGTSADVEAAVNLRSLLARQDKVNQLIAAAEKRARSGVAFSQSFELRKNEMWLRLEVLRSTASQAAVLSLQTLSLKNRMAVVDIARPAKSGSPGLLAFSMLSIVAAGIGVASFAIVLNSRSPATPNSGYNRIPLPEIDEQRTNQWPERADAALIGSSEDRPE